jgi:hypothetical protein
MKIMEIINETVIERLDALQDSQVSPREMWLSLSELTVDGYSGCGLKELHKLAELPKLDNSNKENLCLALTEYYCAPRRITSLWQRMTDAGRDLLRLFIWCKGDPDYDDTQEICKKYGVTFYRQYGWSSWNDKDKSLKAKDPAFALLYWERALPPVFFDALRPLAGKMEYVFTPYSITKSDKLIERENRLRDFAQLVRYCNSNKTTVTQNALPNKSTALGILDFCGYEDVTEIFSGKPSDIRVVTQLRITLPLFLLSVSGGLLSVGSEGLSATARAVAHVSKEPHELAAHLFGAFLKDNKLKEIDLMTGLKSKRGIKFGEARKIVADELKKYPAGVFVPFSDFEKYIRRTNKHFARPEDRYVWSGNYAVEWNHYERKLLNHFLAAFCALGILDLAWGKEQHTFSEGSDSTVTAFRITKLGEYVLGMTDSYAPPKAKEDAPKGGFTVLPDYSIMLPESKDRIKHEMYFERFLTKISDDPKMAVFKLDFESAARALSHGISIESIGKYLQASEKPLPDNVIRALKDWEKQGDRIKIRQVTLLECDDPILLEELLHIKGMGECVSDRPNAVVVLKPYGDKKAKELIEKSGRFCKDV